MFCENCGATMRDGSQFCSSCGTKVAVKVDYNYNRDLSEFHQRVWQDVLGLSATIDEDGFIDFEQSALGELHLFISEGSPECSRLGCRFFDDKTRSPSGDTYQREDLMRICNSVNGRERAKLAVSDTYNVVRASVELVLAAPGRMPDEALLRAVIGRAMTEIATAIDEFGNELEKLDSSTAPAS